MLTPDYMRLSPFGPRLDPIELGQGRSGPMTAWGLVAQEA